MTRPTPTRPRSPRTSSSRCRARCWARPRWPRRCSTTSSCSRSRPTRRSSSWCRATTRSPSSGAARPPRRRLIRSSPSRPASPTARTAPVRTRCTIRTSAASTSRATGSIAAGSDNPSELQLIAQFDYAPDPADGKGIFTDFRGTVNPTAGCAPELGVHDRLRHRVLHAGARAAVRRLDGRRPGRAPSPRSFQATACCSRRATAQVLPGTLDTAFTDIARGRLAQGVTTTLTNSGVPFMFIDQERAEQPAVLLLGGRVRRELAWPRVRRASSRRATPRPVTPGAATEQSDGRERPRDARHRARRGDGHHHHARPRRSTPPPASSAVRSSRRTAA